MPDEEVISFFERTQRVAEQTGKSISELTRLNRDLVASQDEIIKTLRDGLQPSQKALQEYKKIIKVKKDYQKVSDDFKAGMKEEESLSKRREKAVKDYGKALEKGKEATKAAAKELDKINALYQKQQEAVKKSMQSTATFNDKLKMVSGGLGTMKGAFGSAKSSIMGFVGALGVGGISLSSMIKSGQEYDRNLFSLARTQRVAGRGAGDFSRSLDTLSEKTSLATVEFVTLAKTIQENFLGIRPSMEQTAELMGLIAQQVGPTYEAQEKAVGKLISVQKSMPQLYDDIFTSMQKLRDAGPEGLSQEEEKRMSRLRETIALMASQGIITRDAMDSALKMTTAITAEEKDLNEVLKARRDTEIALKDAQLELYDQARPLIIWTMKGLTKIVDVMMEWKDHIPDIIKGIVGIKGAMGGLKIGATIGSLFGPWGTLIGGAAGAAVGLGAGLLGVNAVQKKINKDLNKQVKEMSFAEKQ